MPKRSAQEKLARYKHKIRKLEEKEERRRRIRRLLDSSEDENITDTNAVELDVPEGPSLPCEEEHLAPSPVPQDIPEPVDDVITSATELRVDPELLCALGASTSGTPDFGENVHESLASLWNPLLKKGLFKEDKEKLLKEHLIPANCRLLQTPKLNADIPAAVSDIVRGRDKKLAGFQQLLGHGTAAINKAMDTLLKSDIKALALALANFRSALLPN